MAFYTEDYEAEQYQVMIYISYIMNLLSCRSIDLYLFCCKRMYCRMRNDTKVKRVKLLAVLRVRIRDPVPFWPLDPGFGIGFFRIPEKKISDPWSRISNPYFWKLCDNFLGKKFYNFFKICQIFFFFPSRIPDPKCLHPGSRIRIKEFKYFNPKKMVSKL